MDIKVEKLERAKKDGLPANNRFSEGEFHLSQSTMKMHRQWADRGLCGIIYREVLLGNLKSKTSEEARKGQYFEYLCTTARPAYGDPVPEPERYKRDANANEGSFKKGEVKPDWQHPEDQSDRFHEYCKLLGLRLVGFGVRIKKHGASGNLDCIFQVEESRWEELLGTYHVEDFNQVQAHHAGDQPEYKDCTWTDPATGEVLYGCIVVDLKYSAMLYDKWTDASWNLELLPSNEDHVVQAKHYHWLSGGLPFFFWVFSSVDNDNRLIRVYFEQGAIDRHVNHPQSGVNNIRRVIVNAMKQDTPAVPAFKAQPTIRQCGACPLSSDCKHRARVPLVFGVHVS